MEKQEMECCGKMKSGSVLQDNDISYLWAHTAKTTQLEFEEDFEMHLICDTLLLILSFLRGPNILS